MAKPSSAKEQDNLVCQDVIRNGLDRAVDVTQNSQGRSAKCPRPHEPSRQRAAHRFSQARREATTLKSPEPDTTKSEAYFDSALSVARKQQAKSWELRAAMSMARLWREQGKQKEAHDLLAPVYGWFTEGFDTLDLKEARALLDELNA